MSGQVASPQADPERTITRRLSDDGSRWVVVERWLDRQVDPPKWRSKNRTVKLKRSELLYFAQRGGDEAAMSVAAEKPWLRGHNLHPRWGEYLELERQANEAYPAMEAATAAYLEASKRRAAVGLAIYGDIDRLDWQCDRCGLSLPKRRIKDVTGWETWTLDNESGDMACRCPQCAADLE